MLRKSAVLDVGNFNQDLRHSEDRELGQRLIKAGFKIIGDPNLVVYSIKKDSIWSVLERYWRWYGGEYESMSFGDYVRSIRGSFRPMIQQDINDCDWGSCINFSDLPALRLHKASLKKNFFKITKAKLNILYDGPYITEPKAGVVKYFSELSKSSVLSNTITFSRYQKGVTATDGKVFLPPLPHFRPHKISFYLEFLWHKFFYQKKIHIVHPTEFNLSPTGHFFLKKVRNWSLLSMT